MTEADIAAFRTAVALRDDDAILTAVSTDFGRVVHRTPRAVVRPRSPEDVRRTLEYAWRAGIPVSVRGAGHSQAGQSLTDGGIALDMTGLDRIGEIHDGVVRVQAGVTWRKLVHHVQARGWLPPVLTTSLDVTVGGTLSMGGLGAASHRHGAQADNVEELVAITGDARPLRCSRAENRALFDCVRCGLGQFGVITEASIRLRRTLPGVRTFFLVYDDAAALMKDQEQVLADDCFEYVASACLPRAAGLASLLAPGSRFSTRRYVMRLTKELDDGDDFDADAALIGLHSGRLLGVEDGSTRDLPFALDQSGPENRNDRSLAHPWIEGILPWRTAAHCVEEILSNLPRAFPAQSTVVLWSARRDRFDAPMLVLPDDELLMGLGVLPAVQPAVLPGLLPGLEAVGRRLTAMGGKRYLSGWVDYDHSQWRAPFGRLWPRVVRWKAAFDPAGVLNPGFVRYRPG